MANLSWVRSNVATFVSVAVAALALVAWATRIDTFISESTNTHKALLEIVDRLDVLTNQLQKIQVAAQEKRDWTRSLCDEGPPNGLSENSVRCQWIRGYPR